MLKNFRFIVILLSLLIVLLSGCADNGINNMENSVESDFRENTANDNLNNEINLSSDSISYSEKAISESSIDDDFNPIKTENNITYGSETLRGFILDNIYHSENSGDIHFCSYVPDSYDGNKPYALFITLPGWEGLYFKGAGENLKWENFGITAQEYNSEMIIISPQLNDWGETSAEQTIDLTEYLISIYNIDREKVYLEGYSGGGETGSIAICKRPDLYTAYLMVSSKWDGDLNALSKYKTPVYMAIGEKDSYYGSEPLKEAYSEIHTLYENQGLTDKEINKILILDVKQQDYFSSRGVQDQHAGGGLFADDSDIMGWLFGEH